MLYIFKLIFLTFLLQCQPLYSFALSVNDHRIAVLVNDQLITSYDIVQRMKMNAIISGIDVTVQNNNQLTNSAIEELIREKLKYEKLNEYDISVSNDEYLMHESIFYKNVPLNKKQVMELFEINKINYNEFRNYLIYEISWQKLVSGKYYRLTSTSEIEIEELISKNPGITRESAQDIIIQKQLDLKSSKMIRDMLNEATIEYK